VSAFLGGKVIGAFFGAIVIAAVVTFFVRKLRSSTAVGLGAAGWILTMAVRAQEDSAVVLGAFVAAILCALLAIVLGIRERGRAMAGERPANSDATGAIALGGILLALGGIGVAIGVVRGQSPTPSSSSSPAKGAPAKPPERLAFPGANFAYSVPADFLKFEVPADAPDLSLSVGALERPHVSVQVRSWTAPGTTLAELAAAAKKARLASDPTATILFEKPLSVRDLAGRAMRVDSKGNDGAPLAYLTWSFVFGDHCYSIAIWTNHADAKVLEERAEELLEAFEILDRAGGRSP